MENSKPWYKSKSLWVQALGVVAIGWPPSAAFIQEHFAASGAGWAILNAGLRFISKDKIELS